MARCEWNITLGGDVVVECMTPAEVLDHLPQLSDVKEHCAMLKEQSLNQQWGDILTDLRHRMGEWEEGYT